MIPLVRGDQGAACRDVQILLLMRLLICVYYPANSSGKLLSLFFCSVYGLGLLACSNSQLFVTVCILRYFVGLLGRRIRPSQGLCQQRAMRIYVHASGEIRTRCLRVRMIQDRSVTHIISPEN
jgi:hypothetical protein